MEAGATSFGRLPVVDRGQPAGRRERRDLDRPADARLDAFVKSSFRPVIERNEEVMTTDLTDRATVEDSILTDTRVRERLRPLPPSSKLIARVLTEESGLAQDEVVERTLLPPRTVRYGLTRLEEADIVDTMPSLQDPRKQVYLLQP